MRKLFTHPVFLLVVMLIVAGALLVGAKKVQGFSWFGLWTQKKNVIMQSDEIYTQKTSLDDTLMQVISAHEKLALSVHIAIGPSRSSLDIPSFLSNSQRLLSTDVSAYLENLADKGAALDSLIGQLEYYRLQGVNFDSDLQANIQQQTLDYNQCGTAKQQADTRFYQGLNEGDESLMQQGLQDSQINGGCQTKARINTNAYKAMLSRVQSVNVLLLTLSTLLSQNRDTIITNYPLFKDSYLEKLISLRNAIRITTQVVE